MAAPEGIEQKDWDSLCVKVRTTCGSEGNAGLDYYEFQKRFRQDWGKVSLSDIGTQCGFKSLVELLHAMPSHTRLEQRGPSWHLYAVLEGENQAELAMIGRHIDAGIKNRRKKKRRSPNTQQAFGGFSAFRRRTIAPVQTARRPRTAWNATLTPTSTPQMCSPLQQFPPPPRAFRNGQSLQQRGTAQQPYFMRSANTTMPNSTQNAAHSSAHSSPSAPPASLKAAAPSRLAGRVSQVQQSSGQRTASTVPTSRFAIPYQPAPQTPPVSKSRFSQAQALHQVQPAQVPKNQAAALQEATHRTSISEDKENLAKGHTGNLALPQNGVIAHVRPRMENVLPNPELIAAFNDKITRAEAGKKLHPSIMSAPLAFDAECELSTPREVAHMSWHANAPYLTFNEDNLRRSAGKSLKGKVEPECMTFEGNIDLLAGFESFVQADPIVTPCEAVVEWIMSKSDDQSTIASITNGADFVAGSELLSKIAQTPYASSEHAGWVIGGFRAANTVFLFEDTLLEKHGQELLEEYQREVFRHKLTREGYDTKKAVNGNESFHRILSAEVGFPGDTFRILYAAPIHAVDRNGNAEEMRVDAGEPEDDAWYAKSLRWFVEARLKGAHQINVGAVADGKACGMAQVPTDWLATQATEADAWRPNVAFTFLYDVLAGLRLAVQKCEMGQVVAAVYRHSSRTVKFTRLAEVDSELPITKEFNDMFLETSEGDSEGWLTES